MEHGVECICYLGLDITDFDRLDYPRIFVDNIHCLITFIEIILIISHTWNAWHMYGNMWNKRKYIDISKYIFMDMKSNIDIWRADIYSITQLNKFIIKWYVISFNDVNRIPIVYEYILQLITIDIR